MRNLTQSILDCFIAGCALNIGLMFHECGITYKQADKILELATEHIKELREHEEYNSVEAYLRKQKTCNADDKVVDTIFTNADETKGVI